MTADEIRSALRCDRPRCSCHRGKNVHAPCHDDGSPSFGIDERGGKVVIVCRAGCNQQRALDALRALGLWGAASGARRDPLPMTQLAEARRDIFDQAMREKRHLLPYIEGYFLADEYRETDRIIARVRRQATALGDCEQAWELAVAAADLELALHNRECDG